MRSVFRFLPFAALCFLIFLSGAMLTYHKLFPYLLVHSASTAWEALQARHALQASASGRIITELPVLEAPLRVNEAGAFWGYTLFTAQDSRAFLVNMEGKTVYQWQLKNEERGPAVSAIKWVDAHMQPNGDLIVVEQTHAEYPYGYSVRKLDKDSNTLWRTAIGAHHMIELQPDGSMLALWHRDAAGTELVGSDVAHGQLLEEMLSRISAQGEVVQTVSLSRLLVQHGLLKRADLYDEAEWDMVHPNSVMALPAEMAEAFPMLKPGDVLVSLRNLSAFVVIDLQADQLLMSKRGPWREQHDARFMPDGTIMMFDNQGMTRRRMPADADESQGRSRILSFDLSTQQARVIYGDKRGEAFFSKKRGRVQTLPNQNLLITASDEGRIFEVDASRRVVWEYANPYFDITEKRSGIVIMAHRYAPEQADFFFEPRANTGEY